MYVTIIFKVNFHKIKLKYIILQSETSNSQSLQSVHKSLKFIKLLWLKWTRWDEVGNELIWEILYIRQILSTPHILRKGLNNNCKRELYVLPIHIFPDNQVPCLSFPSFQVDVILNPRLIPNVVVVYLYLLNIECNIPIVPYIISIKSCDVEVI